ncbi:hypothetical protein CTAYLR_010414 [Chrysophaeum taylorii]|uniref:Uncharacterized protein n=1 Tax=Chrysophaeum taylorii TaxID=2483200 RepID=A0AAD7UFV7_9STRA|nr:hypothetical protein CTAYLR_010414 [Chrysophaeum taylorii]
MAALPDDWETAYETYSTRLDEKPHDHHTLCNRSFVLLRLNRLEEALDDADHCVNVNPDAAKGHLRRAQALEKLDRKTEALAAAKKAVRLEPTDDAARKLLLKLDDGFRAGISVLHQLLHDAADRRAAVASMLHQRDILAEKWARLDVGARRKLVTRMLSKGFDEIKTAFLDHFRPLEAVVNDAGVDIGLLQQELLAANVVLMTDAVDDATLADAKGRDEPPVLRYVLAAAENRENSPQVCGDAMTALIDSYRFPPFREHPQADRYSNDLIKAQRTTLCLVVSHLLLGGDGLPTITPRHHHRDDGKRPDEKRDDDDDDDRRSDYGDDDWECSSSEEEETKTSGGGSSSAN